MSIVKKTLKFLCSMKFAILLLLLLIAACTAGSVIPQGEIESYYTGYYPENVGNLLLTLKLNDVFHSWWFVGLTLFLCINLLGCNLFRFSDLIRRMKTGFSLEKCLHSHSTSEAVPVHGEPEKFFAEMGFRKIETHTGEDGTEYRYSARNKAGIWGAWLTHLGMLIIIVGFGLGQMYTVKYTVYGVPGQTKAIGDTGLELTIDDFQIALREDETVEQYTAWLTATDPATGESQGGETSVNHPVSLFGMKFYQNSTGWASRVRVFKGEELLQDEILCAGEHLAIEDLPELVLAYNAFYPDYVEGTDGRPASASSEIRNPAYLYTLYYEERVLGMNLLKDMEKITVEDYSIIFTDPQSYTLIQIKHDPFTWLALIGGLILMAALYLAFYLRPEELWAVKQEEGSWVFAGYSRKGGLLYQEKLREKAREAGEKKDAAGK